MLQVVPARIPRISLALSARPLVISTVTGPYPGQTSTTPVSVFRETSAAEPRNRVAAMTRRPEHPSALQCGHCKVDGKGHENHGDGERN